MEQRLHQTSMQQDNLSKVTANAVDAIARRVKHIEIMSNASKRASEKIIDLIQISKDDRSLIKNEINQIEMKMMTYENVTNAKQEMKQMTRKSEIEREQEARHFILIQLEQQEKEQKRLLITKQKKQEKQEKPEKQEKQENKKK